MAAIIGDLEVLSEERQGLLMLTDHGRIMVGSWGTGETNWIVNILDDLYVTKWGYILYIYMTYMYNVYIYIHMYVKKLIG